MTRMAFHTFFSVLIHSYISGFTWLACTWHLFQFTFWLH